jgi:hypothetical protein
MNDQVQETAAPVTKVKKETEIHTQTMKDGRVVEFAGKRKLIKEAFVRDNGAVVVRLDFRNGETREFTIPQNLMNKFASHGAEQKLGDEIAGVEDVEDCVIAVDELIDRLYNGDWSIKRESSGIAGTSILLRALVQLTGKTPDAIKEFLKNKSAADKMALRNSAKLLPIIQALEAEKVSKKASVDTEALLAELG